MNYFSHLNKEDNFDFNSFFDNNKDIGGVNFLFKTGNKLLDTLSSNNSVPRENDETIIPSFDEFNFTDFDLDNCDLDFDYNNNNLNNMKTHPLENEIALFLSEILGSINLTSYKKELAILIKKILNDENLNEQEKLYLFTTRFNISEKYNPSLQDFIGVFFLMDKNFSGIFEQFLRLLYAATITQENKRTDIYKIYFSNFRTFHGYLSLLSTLIQQNKVNEILQILLQQNSAQWNFGMFLARYVNYPQVLHQYLSLLSTLIQQGKVNEVLQILLQQNIAQWNFGMFLARYVNYPQILPQYLYLLAKLFEIITKVTTEIKDSVILEQIKKSVKDFFMIRCKKFSFTLIDFLVKGKISDEEKQTVLQLYWFVISGALEITESAELAKQTLQDLIDFQKELPDDLLADFAILINRILTYGGEEVKEMFDDLGVTCKFAEQLFFQAISFYLDIAELQNNNHMNNSENDPLSFANNLFCLVIYNDHFNDKTKEKFKEDFDNKFFTCFGHPLMKHRRRRNGGYDKEIKVKDHDILGKRTRDNTEGIEQVPESPPNKKARY